MAKFSSPLLQDVDFKGWSYLAEQFRQIKRSLAEQFRQIKRSLAEQFRQIKCSLAEPHVEISFWFGKGDIPNENFMLPLEVHFRVGGCGRTDSAGGAGRISIPNQAQ